MNWRSFPAYILPPDETHNESEIETVSEQNIFDSNFIFLIETTEKKETSLERRAKSTAKEIFFINFVIYVVFEQSF